MKTPKKTKKPHKDFPLFKHATGQWAKKVLGRLRYFGIDPEAALDKWLAEKDDLLAGREPRQRGDGLKLVDLANAFLTAKQHAIDAGELTTRTMRDYYRVCQTLLDYFGKDRRVLSLAPEDFGRFRAQLAKTRGPVSITNAIVRSRVVFKFALDNELIERPVRFGTVFKRPPKKLLRKTKREGGSRVYTPEDCRALIGAAKLPMRAMILLGLNCGFGQTDCSTLPIGDIDLDGGWINFPRPKTEVVRRCPLWPETIAAITTWLDIRPAPADKADEHLAFLTQRGAKWIREGIKVMDGKPTGEHYFCDYVASEFAKLAKRLGVKHRGGFYNLRHTFRTMADGCKDQPAIDCIMGHTTGAMAEEYRERIGDDRLRAVAEHVRKWLGESK